MKASEVLEEAFEVFDGGKKWVPCAGNMKTCFCAHDALSHVLKYADRQPALSFLRRAVDSPYIAQWNDSAPDFSVIEAGFRKAIELAQSEGQ